MTKISPYLPLFPIQQYFSVPEFTTLIQFERPFLTQRIRIRPVDWFDSDGTDLEFVCMGVALYGCLQSEGLYSDFLSGGINGKVLDLPPPY